MEHRKSKQKQQICGLSYNVPLIVAALCVSMLGLCALPARAQLKSQSAISLPGGCRTGSESECFTTPIIPDLPPIPKPVVINDEKCLPWNLSPNPSATVSAPALKVSSKARSEYGKACSASHAKKFDEAEQHLRAAIAKTPDYPAAWVMLGVVLDEQHKDGEAREACSRAGAIDAKYLPASLCAAEFSARNREWETLLDVANAALQLHPDDNGYAYYYQALANLNLKNVAEAQKSALHAAELDANHNYEPLYVLLAQIYEANGDKATAATYLRQFLKHSGNTKQDALVTQYLADLESKSGERKRSATGGPDDVAMSDAAADLYPAGTLSSLAELSDTDESWAPSDFNETPLPVDSGAACPKQAVLDGAGQRILELVHNVDRFTATEMLYHEPVDRSGRVGTPVTVQFNYLVSYAPTGTGYLRVNEYRNGSLSRSGFPSQIATVGTPSLVLIFHPHNLDNFEMECEGLGHWHGEPAWQVRFEQREDRPNLTSAFFVGQTMYRVNLRGRAWILADSFQVARLETDLKESVPKIHLNLEHESIEYRPVKSPTDGMELWLPASTEVYMDFLGHRFHRRHVFTDFKIFAVDSQYQIADPHDTVNAPTAP